MPLHLRIALALVAFAAAGSALATFGTPLGTSGSRGYAVAISSGSGLKLVRTEGRTRSEVGPEALACRGVLRVGGLEIGARCRPPVAGGATLASGN